MANELNIGSTFLFGSYIQSSNRKTVKPIEWQILAMYGNIALVVSKYALDSKPYNRYNELVSWEDSTLRKWLNNDFLNMAFTVEEQRAILETEIDNSEYFGYSDFGPIINNNTKDRVFILSDDEASEYFKDDIARRCGGTPYVISKGASKTFNAKVDGRPCVLWWLRTLDFTSPHCRSMAKHVEEFGRLDVGYVASYVACPGICVRPALWIDMASVHF